MPTYSIAIFLLTCSIWACSSADKKDPLLEEAAQYHQKASEVQEVVEPKIEKIDSLKQAITAQKRPNTQATIAMLDSLKTAFQEWEENLVEVPSMPHNHTHQHGDHRAGGPEHHHHTDATLKDLPADQMRDLQRETLKAIQKIQSRLNAILKQAGVSF